MIMVNGEKISETLYPDGTPSIHMSAAPQFSENIHGGKGGTIDWYYEDMKELFYVISIARWMKDNGIHDVILKMPYIPTARMDRVKDPGDIHFLKYFCEMINNTGFRKVIVMDPHSSVSEGLIDRIEVLNPKKFVEATLSRIQMTGVEVDSYFFPDEGAMKRYTDILKAKPYAFGIKKRDWKTGEIQGITIMNEDQVAGKNILIVDDICSAGGTFYFSAKRLKELNANKIYLYITHCENTLVEHLDRIDGLIERVYTTNTIFTATGLTNLIEVVNGV